MIDNFQIYPLIVEPMKNTLINGDEKPLDTIPDQFTDRYTLYNLDLEHIGFFGKVYYHDTKLFKEYMSIYTSKLNTININELGNYFAGVLEHEYDRGNNYILQVEFPNEKISYPVEQYIFLQTKDINNQKLMTVAYKGRIKYIIDIERYFIENFSKMEEIKKYVK